MQVQKKISRHFIIIRYVLFSLAAFLCLGKLVNSPVALAGGFLFAHFLGNPFQKINSKAVNGLLKIAVIGLGFGMNLREAAAASKDAFLLVIGSVFLTLGLGIFGGKLLKLHPKTAHLIGSGTAICGGSAIAAVAPVIGASEKDITVSLGVVFLLNSLALVLFPALGHFLNLSQYQFGLWSAIAIHDTSSVVGAAYAYGNEALQVATTVKLARALWIIPVSLISIFIMKGETSKIKIPWFIIWFVAALSLNSFLALPGALTSSVTGFSKSLLVFTLFLIGAGLSIEKMKSAGWKPMILGISLWIIISALSLVVIKLM